MANLVNRTFWHLLIEDSWKHRSIIWLSGVRRTGKTSLAQTLSNSEYFDCELPRTRRMMDDPEEFLSKLKHKRVVIDEIHRLKAPTELLKIAADHYPTVKILATGSSTLGASRKFRDTLTGRKISLWLTPMMIQDLIDFDREDLDHRLFQGGLPPFFLAQKSSEKDLQEWLDSYWAKDIQELFRVERKFSFQRFVELVLARSGGIFEANKFTSECEASRQTISNYLRVLEDTHVAHVLRPYSTHRSTEIISAPKVYGFDTGFVCSYRGWDQLRPDDKGILWEHFILNELQARLQTNQIRYWRNKSGREIDFILPTRKKQPIAIECKWKASAFDPSALKAFRHLYPQGENFIVCSDVNRSYTRGFHPFRAQYISLAQLIDHLKNELRSFIT